MGRELGQQRKDLRAGNQDPELLRAGGAEVAIVRGGGEPIRELPGEPAHDLPGEGGRVVVDLKDQRVGGRDSRVEQSHTDTQGNTLKYAYDAVGNLITLTYP
ncbi:MAG: RHS repeat protein, partial [Deltaproteobacteria bacterium]|nr:RHS repeat protein [Deltaproteobacteria bacterium]